MAQIKMITITPTTGDMVAGNETGGAEAFYNAKDKKCTDSAGVEIDCPQEIKDQLKDPNTMLVVGLVVLIAVVGLFAILYFTKS